MRSSISNVADDHFVMRTRITIKAPAKLNLTLEVVGKLPNGFHRFRSVLVKLDKLADVIDIQIGADTEGITISSDAADLPVDERNICYQATRNYLRAIGQAVGVHLHIHKRIPIAAGLGGGSSDAASVLVALNEHFKQRLSKGEVEAIGSSLGKDIPFFLGQSQTGYVSEAGEKVRALPALPAQAHFLIVNPRIPISTKDAYQSVSQHVWFMPNENRADISGRMAGAIKSSDIAMIAGALFNDFESVTEHLHPVIKEVKQALIAFGANGALMSGSGSSIFGLFKSKKALSTAAAALRARYPEFIIKNV